MVLTDTGLVRGVFSARLLRLLLICVFSCMDRMRYMSMLLPALLLILSMLSACGSTSEVELTLVAENQALGTEVAAYQATATYAADRLAATGAAVQTQTGRVDQQQRDLESTLVARGTPIEYINTTMPQAQTPVPTRTPLPGTETTAGGASGSSDASVRSPVVQPVVTLSPAPTLLTNLVTATGIDGSGCAAGVSAQFSADVQAVYVVATAPNIRSGTSYVSRWSYAGQEQIAHEWVADYNTSTQECIWFFIDRTEVTFTPGTWSVALEVDGQPAAAPLTFTIGDASVASGAGNPAAPSAPIATEELVAAVPANQPELASLATAAGVNNDGCASGTTTQFSTTSTEIYVTAVARNIPAGTRLVSRWTYNGTEVAVFDWTPDYTITEECIWFFIDQTAVPFAPGNWGVSLEAVGLAVGGQATFVISE